MNTDEIRARIARARILNGGDEPVELSALADDLASDCEKMLASQAELMAEIDRADTEMKRQRDFVMEERDQLRIQLKASQEWAKRVELERDHMFQVEMPAIVSERDTERERTREAVDTARRQAQQLDDIKAGRSPVHEVAAGQSQTTCCGKLSHELPYSHRISSNPELVTCDRTRLKQQVEDLRRAIVAYGTAALPEKIAEIERTHEEDAASTDNVYAYRCHPSHKHRGILLDAVRALTVERDDLTAQRDALRANLRRLREQGQADLRRTLEAEDPASPLEYLLDGLANAKDFAEKMGEPALGQVAHAKGAIRRYLRDQFSKESALGVIIWDIMALFSIDQKAPDAVEQLKRRAAAAKEGAESWIHDHGDVPDWNESDLVKKDAAPT